MKGMGDFRGFRQAGRVSHRPTEDSDLDEFCRTGWHTIYSFIRHRGRNVEEAQDLTQEFFTHLFEKHLLDDTGPVKGGRRRSPLCYLDHFLANEWRKCHATKRGGGQILLRLDDPAEQGRSLEAATDLDPEKLLERQWLLSVAEAARARLRDCCRETGKTRVFEALEEYLCHNVGAGDYSQLGAKLAMSHAAISTVVCRLRHRFHDLVREEIGRTISNPQEIDKELRAMLHAVA